MDKVKTGFLLKNFYKGLENLNDGFDASSIYYFSESDFKVILDRVEKLGIGIFGIEPWLDGNCFDVKGCEEYGMDSANSKWYRKAFHEFKSSGKELKYAASYDLRNINILK